MDEKGVRDQRMKINLISIKHSLTSSSTTVRNICCYALDARKWCLDLQDSWVHASLLTFAKASTAHPPAFYTGGITSPPPDPKFDTRERLAYGFAQNKVEIGNSDKEDSNHERNRSKDSPNLQEQRGRAGSEPPGHHRVAERAACGQRRSPQPGQVGPLERQRHQLHSAS